MLPNTSRLTQKSLLIVGYPKGCTSLVYAICLKALGLKACGISDGEALNPGRNGLPSLRKYLSRDEDSYREIEGMLTKYVGGYVIKDVLHPYAVSRYISEHPDDFNVLFVDRDIRDVLFCQRAAGWKEHQAHVHSCKHLFRDVPSVSVVRLLFDPQEIYASLRRLGYHPDEWDYRTPDFLMRRKQTLLKLRGVAPKG